jgi:excisionase family DNA binding protein
MSAERITEALTDMVRNVVRAVLDETLPAAIARQLHAVERADTDEARELRRICAQEYLTKREAALFLNVSESHIDNLVADDASLPVHRVGAKNIRFRRAELIEWTREQGRRRLRAAS